MIDSGAVVLGARRRWLGPLARAVLAVYHRPPADRPRELAELIARSEVFTTATEAARVKGSPVQPVGWRPAPSRMVRRRWPVPVIDDVAGLASLLDVDIARLDWLADPRSYQRRTPVAALHPNGPLGGPLHPYRYRWVPRRGRTPRLIEAPTAALRQVQRRLLHEVLALIPVHEAAHGFVRGRSVASATQLHSGSDMLLVADLLSFFSSISAGRVYGLMRRAGYPEPVAHILTGLLTVRTPVAVLSAMPDGGRPEDRFALRALLQQPHLAQGAPTSPALANAVAYRFDARCAGYAAAAGFRYTRYADDLLFSADLDSRGVGTAQHTGRFTAGLGRIATEEGFALNPHKTRSRTEAQSQRALGVVVNHRPTVPRAEYDRLRAILHNAARTSGPAQNRDGHPDFRAHLAGRIGWVASLDPERGIKLHNVFRQIDWDE